MKCKYHIPVHHRRKFHESQRLGNAPYFFRKKKKNYSVGVGYDIKVSTWKGIELLDIYRNLSRQQRPCKDTIEDKKAEKIQNLAILIGLRAGYTTVIDTVAKMEQSFVSRY